MLLASGCDRLAVYRAGRPAEVTPPSGLLCSDDGWCWENPLPMGDRLLAVWGVSADDLWVVGDRGTLVHYVGSTAGSGSWTRSSVDGAAVSLYDLWGRAKDDIYAVGERGTVLHYDGARWSQMATPTEATLLGVWGDNDRVYAVGKAGTILVDAGQGFEAQSSGTQRTLHAVWGSGAGHVVAVGEASTILHLAGDRWLSYEQVAGGGANRFPLTIAPSTPSAAVDLLAVSGSGPSDIFVAGAGGVVRHFDGTSWRALPSGTTARIHDFAASADGAPLAVGADGLMLTFDGAAFRPLDSGTDRRLYSAWRSPQGDVFAAGSEGIVVRYDGTRALELAGAAARASLYAVASRGGTAYAVGSGGVIVERRDKRWLRAASGTDRDLYAVSVASDGAAFAVGQLGVTLRGGGDGGWQLIGEPSARTLRGVWAASGANVTAVGHGGTILRYDGVRWRAEQSGSDADLLAVWGYLGGRVAVGSFGTLLRERGGRWSADSIDGLTAEAQQKLVFRGVGGSGPDDIYAVGDGGVVARYDGQRWRLMSSPTSQTLRAVSFGPRGAAYAVGVQGVLLELVDGRWRAHDAGTTRSLWGVSAGDEGHVVVGDQGTILRRDALRPELRR
ncbi:MAG: hypothetical protein KC503_00625 [Myxococcales bacterium]|nr:hypothetical protein [Myxococcales bacterium]